MPVYGQNSFGDLYVEYTVVLPKEISPDMQRRRPSHIHLTYAHC